MTNIKIYTRNMRTIPNFNMTITPLYVVINIVIIRIHRIESIGIFYSYFTICCTINCW